jgi:hypothetical protein
MHSQKFSGRPKRQLGLTIVFGLAATRAYQGGERDQEVLNRIGRFKYFSFDSLEEMNAFILGIEEAVGYLDTHFVDD